MEKPHLGVLHVFEEEGVLFHARDSKCVGHRPHLQIKFIDIY